jgi:formylglycine-generating enzyme required for sulfatase activity
MSHESDPNFYSMMLGLPEELRRPNHYQLLGLEPALADRETIKDAAAERNGKLMAWQNSTYFKEAGRLMLELATARGVLLDPEKKLAYDQQLGLITVDEEPVILLEAEPEEEPIVLQAVEEAPKAKTPRPRRGRTSRSSDVPDYLRQKPRWKQALIPSVAILLLGAIVWAGFGGKPGELEPEPDPPAEQEIASIDDSGPPRPWQTEPSESQHEAPPQSVSINRETVDVPETPRNKPASNPPPPLAKAPFDSAKAKEHRAEWAAYLNVPAETTNSIGMKMRLIPPGEFQMGSPPGEPGYPQHPVRITKPFYAGTHEVTVQEFREITNYVPPSTSRGQFNLDPDLPVMRVHWCEAVYFCNQLSIKEGLPPYYKLSEVTQADAEIVRLKAEVSGGIGYRLPTEAEWEYACRAGTESAFYYGDSLTEMEANIRDPDTPKGGTSLKPPGSFPANAFGLSDMHGSLREWCFDSFPRDEIRRGLVIDPIVKPPANEINRQRVFRGGSYGELAVTCQSDYVRGYYENYRGSTGFRVVRNVKQPESEGTHAAEVTKTPIKDQPPLARIPFDAAAAVRHQTEWAAHLNLQVAEKTKDGLELKLIPAGEFQMGSPENEPGRQSNEDQHKVRLTKPFYMGTTEVTNREFANLMGARTDIPERLWQQLLERPVSGITWYDAAEFCNQLSLKEGFPPYYTFANVSKGRTPKGTISIRQAKVTANGA